MGEPMCRNLKRKSGAAVMALDRDAAPLQRLAQDGVVTAHSVREVIAAAELVFLCLPSGDAVEALVHGPEGIAAHLRSGQIVVDLGTSPVDLTRALAHEFAQRSATFIDSPIARTRAAAEAGTLAIMVGADAQ